MSSENSTRDKLNQFIRDTVDAAIHCVHRYHSYII